VPGRAAILIVNGFDRVGFWGKAFDGEDALRYPWIELCLRELSRRAGNSDYEVLVWDNSRLPRLRDVVRGHGARLYPADDQLEAEPPLLRHHQALAYLLSATSDETEYVITLDTDAVPIRDRWIELLTGKLEHASLTGVWRDEMAAALEPFVHPSCMCIRRDRLLRMQNPFTLKGVQDVGQRITRELMAAGESIEPLRRSNVRNAHFLIGGIYGDLVYHHAAGSRRPVFRMTEGAERDELIYRVLRQAAFGDFDHLIAVLRGEAEDDLAVQE
jgi:hypothetical protein